MAIACAPLFLLGFFHFLSDSVQSFIPGDLDEFSRSALANALERNLKSLFAVCMLNLRDAFQTNCLITFVRPIIRLDQDQTPITNRAFEMAVTLTVTIMERISDPLPRLGVGLLVRAKCRLRSCWPRLRGRAPPQQRRSPLESSCA